MRWVKHPVYNIEANELGQVRGPRGIRIARKDRYGYLRLNVAIKGGFGATKTLTIHRIMADCFTLPGSGTTVDHINGNKEDNRLCNLQLLDQGTNASLSFTLGRREGLCKPLKIGDTVYYSRREAQRCTGISRQAKLITRKEYP